MSLILDSKGVLHSAEKSAEIAKYYPPVPGAPCVTDGTPIEPQAARDMQILAEAKTVADPQNPVESEVKSFCTICLPDVGWAQLGVMK